MSRLLIITFSLLFIIMSCSAYKNTVERRNMNIVNAGYHRWSKPPINGSVPERGVDLALIIDDWPSDAEPGFIIFNGRQSSKATIVDKKEVGVVISAQILVASSVMDETSPEVDLSDRIVYTTANGKTQSVDIDEWTNIEQ